jgi:hypothetical protein
MQNSQPKLHSHRHCPPHTGALDGHAGIVVVVVEDVVVVVGHGPQSSIAPQPSGIDPQVAPWAVQVVGVQPQTLAMPPPPHVCGAVQVPQLSMPPQPSEMLPQVAPWAEQVVGVQQEPLKQVWPVGQPQVRVSPQSPSGIVPHRGKCAAHVVGVQHAPKRGFGFPGRGAGMKQSRLQQLMFVTHC